MIQMNFDNTDEGDDKHLIQLLKEEITEFPSEELTEKTMIKISAMQGEKKFAYKPLRAPLYMMTVISLLLLIPYLIPTTSNSLLLDPLSKVLAYPEISILKYPVWCWLAMVVWWISKLLFQVQSRSTLNPLKQ